MPSTALGAGGGGGGSGFSLGPSENTFGTSSTANRAAAETLRNTYATANTAWLTEYNGDRSFWIQLVWTGNAYVVQRRNGAGTAWEDVTPVIRGRTGSQGALGSQARFDVHGYINATTAPTTAPPGGTFVRSTGVLTLPTGYAASPATPATGAETYRIEAFVNPATDTDTVNLVWSVPALLPAYAIVAAAEAAETGAETAETAAAASAAAAAGDAGLVTSYSGPALIVDAVAFTSDDTDIAVADWRDYDLLGVTFLDSSANAETYQCLVSVDSLDANGKAQMAVEQNAQIEITATDDSDSLNFNFAGAVTGFPSTGDTISIWGMRVGVGAGGGSSGASLSDDTPEDVGTSASGSGTEASRSDHVHGGSTGGGTTNLAIDNRDADSLDVTSSTGTDATVPSASTTQAGLQSSTDKIKLDGIEAAATEDQTDTEIKTAYEANADTNAFTDALQTKLNGVAAGATDVTIQNVLDQIMAGTNITIDTTTAGQITISSSGGGGGGFTLHSGAGTPADSLGADDDWYLNTDDGAWFKKTGGTWGSAVYTDMVGQAGTTDGVVNSASIAADGTVTLGRSIGADVTADFSTVLALLTGATFTGEARGVTPADDDSSTQFATTEFVEDGFHGASFSNATRRLVLSRLGGGTAASLPLTYLNAFQGIDPVGSNTYHGGDSAKVSGKIYMYTANISASVATADIPGDNRFDLLTGGAVSTAHDLYAGWSPDNAVTSAEVLLGANTDTDTITLPTGSGNEFLWIWRADEDGGDPSEVHIAGGGNVRNTFGNASALTVDSISGQLIISVTTQNVGLLGGEIVRVV